jgi:hypothetical protein
VDLLGGREDRGAGLDVDLDALFQETNARQG